MIETAGTIFAEAPKQPERFRARNGLAYLAGAPTAGGVAALLAEVIQNDLHWAPLLLFPMFIGVILGGMLVAVARLVQAGHRPTLLFGAVAAAATAVVGQHFLAYWNLREPTKTDNAYVRAQAAFPDLAERLDNRPKNWNEFITRSVQQGRPLVGTWVARGGWVWASWALDAVLLLGCVLAVVLPASRMPYCEKCGTWWRTILGGRWQGEAAQNLLNQFGAEGGGAVVSVRYRLSSCRGGCGPFGLALVRQAPNGESYTYRFWLSPEGRDRVIQLADEVARARSTEENFEDDSPPSSAVSDPMIDDIVPNKDGSPRAE